MSTKLRLEGILSYADISRNLGPKIIWATFLNSQSPNNPPIQQVSVNLSIFTQIFSVILKLHFC